VQAFLDDLTPGHPHRLPLGAEARPGLALRLLSWAGILFLSGFSLFFLYSRYFAG